MGIDVSTLQDLGLIKPKAEGLGKSTNQLLQDDFLKLMTTQLQAQDPLEPDSQTDFLGQMAQFGTVSGIDDLNNTMRNFGSAFLGTQSLQASNLVGRNVLAELGAGFLPTDGPLQGFLELPSSAINVKIQISDNNGQLVKTLNMGTLPSGQSLFSWDGKSDNGAQMPPGNYVIQATGDVAGKAQSISVLSQSKVQSVSLGNGESVILNLEGLGPMPFSEVKQIQ